MPIDAVAGAVATPLAALARTAPSLPTSAPSSAATTGTGFGQAVAGALQDLSATQQTADQLATAAATGQLPDVHDYTIAATEAALATELTVAVRNKALEAFQQIMNLPL